MEIAVVIILSLLFSAIFSGLEIAFVTADKMQISLEEKKGEFIAKILSKFTENQSRFLATLLIGNNFALVFYGMYMEKLLATPIDQFSITNPFVILIIQTLVSTIILIILSEYVPKSIFRIRPIKSLKIFALPIYPIYWALRGVVWVVVSVSKWMLKVAFKVEIEDEAPIFDKVDLENFLEKRTRTSADTEEIEHEIRIYKNALDFANIKARECMVPRTELVCVDVQSSIESLSKSFSETGLSKVLIYKDSIDNIIGFVHSRELFKSKGDLRSMLLPVFYVPETMNADQVLNSFIQKKMSIAIVVDEFGGTSGIITVEDIVEEIFGDIEDEHDNVDLVEEQIDEFEFLFSARLEIDDLNANYNLNLPSSEEYETLGGLILSVHETIPNEGEHVKYNDFDFIIEKVGETRIELIRVFLPQINSAE